MADAELFFSDDLLQFLNAPCELYAEEQQSSAPPDAHSSATTSTERSKFATVCDSDLGRLKDKNKNGNTSRSTNTWVRRFKKWQEDRGLHVDPTCIESQELGVVLQRFFAEIRKEDGSEYEPDSLRTMLSALDRYFREEGYPHRILKDKEFEAARKVLNGYAIELREKGMGKRKRRADAITEEEEEMMWSKGVLGGNNPRNLNDTVFYLLSLHYGTRGCQEHHQVYIEELKIVKNTNGDTEYIEWVEGQTKTRRGGLTKSDRRVTQRVFADGSDRCPVVSRKTHLKKTSLS